MIRKNIQSCLPLKLLHIVMEHCQLSPTEQRRTATPMNNLSVVNNRVVVS